MKVQISKVAPRTWTNDQGQPMYTHKCFAFIDPDQEHPSEFDRTFREPMTPGEYELEVTGWSIYRGKLNPRTELRPLRAASKQAAGA